VKSSAGNPSVELKENRVCPDIGGYLLNSGRRAGVEEARGPASLNWGASGGVYKKTHSGREKGEGLGTLGTQRDGVHS